MTLTAKLPRAPLSARPRRILRTSRVLRPQRRFLVASCFHNLLKAHGWALVLVRVEVCVEIYGSSVHFKRNYFAFSAKALSDDNLPCGPNIFCMRCSVKLPLQTAGQLGARLYCPGSTERRGCPVGEARSQILKEPERVYPKGRGNHGGS